MFPTVSAPVQGNHQHYLDDHSSWLALRLQSCPNQSPSTRQPEGSLGAPNCPQGKAPLACSCPASRSPSRLTHLSHPQLLELAWHHLRAVAPQPYLAPLGKFLIIFASWLAYRLPVHHLPTVSGWVHTSLCPQSAVGKPCTAFIISAASTCPLCPSWQSLRASGYRSKGLRHSKHTTNKQRNDQMNGRGTFVHDGSY